MTNCKMGKAITQDMIRGCELLSRTECSALRGIAILGIFLHNYLHWLRQMVKENEYQFHQGNIERMTGCILDPTWDLPLQLFSFFGHYGVPVFLFLSGYGLVQKYENARSAATPSTAEESLWQFIKKHFMKLFPMMMLGFTVFAMTDWITPSRHHWSWSEILGQVSMTINLFPDPDKAIWPGPYWFFGLMMQLYLLYRIALYKRGNMVVWLLIAACWAIQALCFASPDGATLNWIRYNCIGGMLPFGMGILLARMPAVPHLTRSSHISRLIALLAAVVSMSLVFHTWLWIPAFIVLLHISLVKTLPAICIKVFNWLGTLSAAIFVCHPITRKIFIPISRGGDIMDGLVLYIVCTLMLAVLFKMAIERIRN